MGSFYLLLPAFIAIVISMLIVRAGAVALMMTGLNYEKSKFQALSAFSGTGFTTREAELIVNHSQRRKIISWLMILGNAGIVTVIVATTSSFAKAKGVEIGINVITLAVGLAVIVGLARNMRLVRKWERYAQKRLSKFKLFSTEKPVDELLHITEGYGITRIEILEDSPLINQSLAQVNSNFENSLVLGIESNQKWIPSPRMNRKLKAEDVLIIYGYTEELGDFFGER